MPVKKCRLFILVTLLSPLSLFSQYWQQDLRYSIDVTLNDTENTLDGFERIDYTNHSPDTLRFIWFHLWPNAYKNDKTAYTDQALQNGSTAFYFSQKDQKGYINRLDFKVDNITADVEDHPEHIDIVKLVLPTPLLPGKSVTITTPFHVKLPNFFNRGGYKGQHYYVAHWFPKPAVYDHKGWHPMPMLDHGEFYGEFGHFDVQITLPANYVVAATGELQNESEKKWLETRRSFTWIPETEKVKVKGITKVIKREFPVSSKETKTLHFIQDRIHDFAWVADKRFVVKQEAISLPSGKKVAAFAFHLPGAERWEKSLAYVATALQTNGAWIGEYPYNTVSVVQDIEGSSGGTEYPTLTVLDGDSDGLLELIIRHEVGHNWFYGILANNERDHPWMDEGINSLYDYRYIETHPAAGNIPLGTNKSISLYSIQERLTRTREAIAESQPVDLSSAAYNPENYNALVYHRTATLFQELEKEIGREAFDRAMQAYYEEWKFKHPYPEDMQAVFEKVSGKDLDAFFQNKLGKAATPASVVPRKPVFTNPFAAKKWLQAINQPDKGIITWSPAIGMNSYDRIMIGALLTNASLPPAPFQFLAIPLYATGTKQFNGLVKLNYSLYNQKGWLRKTDFFLNGARFSMDEATDQKGRETVLGVTKIVPGIRFTWREKTETSTRQRFVQWKSYFLQEDGFTFTPDTIVVGIDTTIEYRIGKEGTSRHLGQLRIQWEDFRALYPWKAELKAEVNADFLRLAFTGNYFFNYAKGGGMNLRFFAGKFLYLGEKTNEKQFLTDRYHLNMTGPIGYEDYTYSDYFVGRNRFEKIPSQQIMVRDGGFKVRTDLLSDKVGKTDDWLAAINLTTTIPQSINPLSILPVKIPLRAFFDIGTYAEPWARNSEEDRFLFDAGLQVSLFKETVNVYFPLIYSRAYKDYIQSVIGTKKFARSISFSIDLANFSPRKIIPTLHF
ncbi:MAG: M1 family metallopeptidase [Chitinophagales bacterium]|nr:M1 family metallopeptidase [Chitinophagales bacterium]